MTSQSHPQNLIYAGIGSRKTPPIILEQMRSIAEQLSPTGWKLRSGGAAGADTAFERGAANKEIHLPWDGYNNLRTNGSTCIDPKPTVEICDIAATHHPKWDELSTAVKLLMARNTTIILGADLDAPAKMVICWTPNGKLVGGTAHGMRIAQAFDIPVFNLANLEDQKKLCDFVLQLERK